MPGSEGGAVSYLFRVRVYRLIGHYFLTGGLQILLALADNSLAIVRVSGNGH